MSELPEGWAWTSLDFVTTNHDGKRIPVSRSERQALQGSYPYYGASGIIDNVNDYLFDGDYLLVAEDGANLLSRSTPIAFRASGKFWVNNHAHVLTTLENVPLSYIEYYLNSIDLAQFVTGTAQPKLTQRNMNRIPIPLAPLAEQKRIADKLDALLARVDRCRARLERVPLILKRFRQAVLAAATSGQLTADWREEHGERVKHVGKRLQITPTGDFANTIDSAGYELPDGWVWLTPDLVKAADKHSLSIGPFGSNLTVKDYRDNGVPLVFVREIRAKIFGDEKTKYVSEEKAKELWAHRVEPGDLLITKMGDPPGDPALFPLDRPISIITADCIRIKVDPKIVNVKLLSFFIESDLASSLVMQITAGVAQQKISLQRFRSMPLPIPPLEEQHEIVRRVELLFAYADRLAARDQAARAQVDRLTPALLAKAFRGELVAQDPGDEPAGMLLARVRGVA